MVEMLGVLAIIGVLSVGGIMGYTTAMRKYKANEIAQAATMLLMMAKAQNGGAGATLNLDETDLTTPIADIIMSADPTSDTVTIANVGDPDLANVINKMTTTAIHFDANSMQPQPPE